MTVPGHWQHFTGPSRWFQLRFPTNWRLVEKQGLVVLHPPESAGTLQILAFWTDEPREIDDRQARGATAIYPIRRRVTPWVWDGEHPGFCFRGEMTHDRRPWWQRFLKRRPWQRWKLWLIHSGQIAVLASYLHPGEFDPEQETLASLIIDSLQIAENPAEPLEVFTARVLRFARETFPWVPCRSLDEEQLQVGHSSTSLRPMYQAYLAAPDDFSRIVEKAILALVEVQQAFPEQEAPAFETVCDRIMPMLIATADAGDDSIDGDFTPLPRGKSRPGHLSVESPWVAGLSVRYVVDAANAYWFVNPDLMRHWGQSLDDLHELALRNLDSYFESHEMQVTVFEEGDLRIAWPSQPDVYNSTRLLSDAFQQRLRGLLGQPCAVGVPNRDFFVAVNRESPHVVSEILAKVGSEYQQQSHPLTERWLLLTMDGVCELIADSSPL